MVIVLFNWSYIFIICLFIGLFIHKFLTRLLTGISSFSITGLLVTGMIGITVYTEFFSIFSKIGMAAHLLLLLTALMGGYLCRRELVKLLRPLNETILSWEGFFYVCLLFLTAFYTSRGTFHTDTNIYHAANIRLYEEYGLIRGMANLQLHYGYNSAYLAFAAIFSLSWLLPFSLHTTTGFIEVSLCIWACRHLKNFSTHTSHLSDAGCICIILYAVVNLTGSMSPATDYPTMFFTLYIITAWLMAIEKKKDVSAYALLSVAAVFVATMKLSAIALAVIVLYPACLLIKKKSWKDIVIYLSMGILIFLPYLIRNVLISGWLIYPFESIDLFHAPWKVPLDYLLADSYQIKVWGRCLFDISKIDMPVSEWLPIWWENQERYSQYLIYANILGLLLGALNFIYKWVKKMEVEFSLICLYLSFIVSVAVWFLLVPFIRYGLAFLLAIPLVGIAVWFDYPKKGFHSILTGTIVLCIFLCFSPYIDHYVTDDGLFLKQELAKPYYFLQKDYDSADMREVAINGNTVYCSVEGTVNDYHLAPSSCYDFMVERTTLIGNTIKEGFMPR